VHFRDSNSIVLVPYRLALADLVLIMVDEKYWSKLETIYVHQVYENISNKYEELFKIHSLSSRTSTLTNDTELHENPDKRDNSNADGKHKKSKYNAWPNVKRFLLELESYSLIGNI
jgi:hypothetical protein